MNQQTIPTTTWTFCPSQNLCTWLPTSKTIPPQPNIRISPTQIQPSSTRNKTGTTNALQPNGNPCTKRHKTFRVIRYKRRNGQVKPYEPNNMIMQYLTIQNNIYLLYHLLYQWQLESLENSKSQTQNQYHWVKPQIHIFN